MKNSTEIKFIAALLLLLINLFIVNASDNVGKSNKTDSANWQDYNQPFRTNGTIEVGGDISFSSQSTPRNNNTFSSFTFNPYIGTMIAGGFELGLMPGFSFTNAQGEIPGTTSINIFLAPAYNFKAGRAYPYLELLGGFSVLNQDRETVSGLGIGGSVGVKFQIGGNGLFLFNIKYLQQKYDIDELNIVLFGAGVRFLFSS